MAKEFKSFAEFYPYYLSEHSHPTCRKLHYVGSFLTLAILAYGLVSQEYWSLWFMPLAGYGFAWIGHFFIEKNKPATFTYPFYSFIGDWVMLKDFLTGKLR
ncbi:DUF962 domain-containing protein [Pleionea sp. CnH1-48]|uniref:DUF962 domain-containing protein n=1 Tax=Pleionea sp. CnH1-48 TaxID=2954494 RepID=UPI0020985EBD|nr:DUF962 domain-containing protein [Pleionea sp. CnH1-48]MCO7224487.1 DUF962 domain-containing protein [Pleionea sp. CnH1-48]